MEIKNRNLFRLTRFVIFQISSLFRLMAVFRKPKKRLLIIKTDAIGDYIIVRNFIEIVKSSAEYKDHEIHLLGNPIWRDIATTYDCDWVTEFMFVKDNDLYESPYKLLKLGWRLFRNNYDVVLQPTPTRRLINDAMAILTAANQLIAHDGDTVGILPRYKRKTDKLYTRLIQLPQEIYFEFDSNVFYFEQVLNKKLAINGPYLPTKGGERNGIVIFPGAGSVKRGWEKEKFFDLIERIMAKTSQLVCITGGPAETAIAKYLVDHFPGTNITDLTGKTTLPELIELIGSATLLVSNETSAIHIAAATKTPSVCILGGGHFERFAPYPQHMAYRPVCVYEKMDCFDCNWNCIYQTPANAPHPCVSIVSVEQVWNATEPLLTA
jgi:ADP-heptose:LPS heptosyltransferase